jgi:hypothetical protein
VPLLAFLRVFAHDSAEQLCGTTVTKCGEKEKLSF